MVLSGHGLALHGEGGAAETQRITAASSNLMVGTASPRRLDLCAGGARTAASSSTAAGATIQDEAAIRASGGQLFAPGECAARVTILPEDEKEDGEGGAVLLRTADRGLGKWAGGVAVVAGRGGARGGAVKIAAGNSAIFSMIYMKVYVSPIVKDSYSLAGSLKKKTGQQD